MRAIKSSSFFSGNTSLNICVCSSSYVWMKYSIFFIVAITGLAIILLLGMIISFMAPIVVHEGIGSLFLLTWFPKQGFFGLLSMIIGSFLLAMLALIIGLPLSVGISLWSLSRVSNSLIVKSVKFLIKSMTAIPTVVYGFTAIFLLIPFVRNFFGGSGFSLLSAGIILSILIVPTMVLIITSALQPRLETVCPEALAVGFSRLELLLFFVIPSSLRVIITAAIIGFGRAIGDTLISLMLSGNTPQVPQSFTEGFRTITAHIALVSANEVSGSAYSSLFLAGFILLSMNVFMAFILRKIGK